MKMNRAVVLLVAVLAGGLALIGFSSAGLLNEPVEDSGGRIQELEGIAALGQSRPPGMTLSFAEVELTNNGDGSITLEEASLENVSSKDLTILGFSVIPDWMEMVRTRGTVLEQYPPEGSVPLSGFELSPDQTVRLAVGVRTESAEPMGFRGVKVSYRSGQAPHEVSLDYIFWICPEAPAPCDPEEGYPLYVD
jgi:hypothetical protein